MKIAIVGGGAAGLFASLTLARAAHGILVLTAGVAEAPLSTQMPASLADTTAWPDDERVTTLMTRRSTIDWVLQRAILAEPGVTLRCGVRVMGLLAVPGEPPHVTGVRTDQGDLAADLVVDACGRRSPIDRWLGEISAQPTATWWAECGLAYFSRHYRLRPGAELPGLPTTRIVAGPTRFTPTRMSSGADCLCFGRLRGDVPARPRAGTTGEPPTTSAGSNVSCLRRPPSPLGGRSRSWATPRLVWIA